MRVVSDRAQVLSVRPPRLSMIAILLRQEVRCGKLQYRDRRQNVAQETEEN